MKLQDGIKSRRSIRKYTDAIVEESLVKEIIDLARWSPSWGNFQVSRYTSLTNEDKIKMIAEDASLDFSYNVKTLKYAKNVMILSYVEGKSGKLYEDNYKTSKGSTWEIFDAGIACQTFCLAAHSKGIGTVIFGVFDSDKIAKIIDLPKEQTVAAVIVYGHPNEELEPAKRLSVDEIYNQVK